MTLNCLKVDLKTVKKEGFKAITNYQLQNYKGVTFLTKNPIFEGQNKHFYSQFSCKIKKFVTYEGYKRVFSYFLINKCFLVSPTVHKKPLYPLLNVPLVTNFNDLLVKWMLKPLFCISFLTSDKNPLLKSLFGYILKPLLLQSHFYISIITIYNYKDIKNDRFIKSNILNKVGFNDE